MYRKQIAKLNELSSLMKSQRLEEQILKKKIQQYAVYKRFTLAPKEQTD